MISLDEFNEKRMSRASRSIPDSVKPCPNDIACPGCGKELVDSTPMLLIPGYPIEMDVSCPSCGYKGYRVA